VKDSRPRAASIQETSIETFARDMDRLRCAPRPIELIGAVSGLLYTLHWRGTDARKHVIIRTFRWERYKAAVQEARSVIIAPQSAPPRPRKPASQRRRRRLRRGPGERWQDRRAAYLALEDIA
jgi:hypothetical protein